MQLGSLHTVMTHYVRRWTNCLVLLLTSTLGLSFVAFMQPEIPFVHKTKCNASLLSIRVNQAERIMQGLTQRSSYNAGREREEQLLCPFVLEYCVKLKWKERLNEKKRLIMSCNVKFL